VIYDFETVVDRHDTNSLKWDKVEDRFGVKDVLPMWVADMDFMSPEPVIKALQKTAAFGIFGYAAPGPSYYEAVERWMAHRHSWPIKREWVVLSPGVVPALNVMVKTFTAPGDEIIVQSPVYHPFFYAIERNGRRVLDSPLVCHDGKYRMDLDDLGKKITPRTKMVLLCSPHNPVGRVWTREELNALGELCLSRGILVVADEIHHDLLYKGNNHVPFAALSQDFADNSVVCTGASKTFNLPGLHTSNIIIPNDGLRERFCAEMTRSAIGSPNTFGLVATEAAYRHGEEWLDQLMIYLDGNVNFAMEYARHDIPGLKIIRPEGTYLLWMDFRDTRVPGARLRDFICQEARVALDEGTIFGCKEVGFQRMNIACPRSILHEGMTRIADAIRAA
jgi:cysteine-S-conjugate beta-lyase